MKKLVLIPYHKYQYFQSLQSEGPHKVHKENTQSEENSTDPKALHEIETPINKENKLETDIILCHISKGKRSKAETFLRYINQSPNLDWNIHGELLVNGKIIPGSHISDLVKDSVTEYKAFQPKGVEELYTHIGNIPLTIITNPKRRALLQTGGQSPPPPGLPNKTETRVLNIEKKTLKKPEKITWKHMWQKL